MIRIWFLASFVPTPCLSSKHELCTIVFNWRPSHVEFNFENKSRRTTFSLLHNSKRLNYQWSQLGLIDLDFCDIFDVANCCLQEYVEGKDLSELTNKFYSIAKNLLFICKAIPDFAFSSLAPLTLSFAHTRRSNYLVHLKFL